MACVGSGVFSPDVTDIICEIGVPLLIFFVTDQQNAIYCLIRGLITSAKFVDFTHILTSKPSVPSSLVATITVD